MFIRSVWMDDAAGSVPAWALAAPAIAALSGAFGQPGGQPGGLDFRRPVTVLTGGNGVGKSTLLEGMARAWGFPLTGGTYGAQKAGAPDPLFGALRLSCTPRAKAGYFLRSETHNYVASKYGEFLGRSHGESILDLTYRFMGNGLYILDEPEAGLSAVSQMALLAQLHALADNGAQVIMATHAPILLAVPGAEIIEITDTGFARDVAVEDTTAFRAMRDFLADPAVIAEYMADWAEDEL